MVFFWALQFVLFGQAETQSLFWGLCKGSCKGEGKHRSTSLMAAPVDVLEDAFALVHTGVQDPWDLVLVTWDQNQLLPLPVPWFPQLKNQEARLRQSWGSCSQFWGSCSPCWGCPRVLPRAGGSTNAPRRCWSSHPSVLTQLGPVADWAASWCP